MNRKALVMLIFMLIALCAAVWLLTRAEQDEPAPPVSSAPPRTSAVSTPGISMSVIEPEADPLYVFIMIGDGMGKNQRLLAECYSKYYGRQALVMNSLGVAADITTHSLNARVTDSAAGSTAIATGFKTDNGMLSVTPEGGHLKTIIEEAEENGLSTGIVTTTSLTNATPAAFAAHNKYRAANSEIALDLLYSGVDFFAGGGASYFLPVSYSGGFDVSGAALRSSREDGQDPLQSFEDSGYMTFIGAQGAQDFAGYSPSAGDRVFASFSNSNMPYEADRINEGMNAPALVDMTAKAIETLAYDKDGFVLMVEGGRIDHACHIGDANSAILETLMFDKAVKAAYDFYLEHPEDTILIVLADHETGGLGFEEDELDVESLGGIKVSIADRVQKAYTGDREAFYEYIASSLGLGDLNPSERARIDKALDAADKADPKEDYGSVVALAVSNVISKRVGVSWASTGHTDAPVPLTAAGFMEQELSALCDNAEVGQFLFDVLAAY